MKETQTRDVLPGGVYAMLSWCVPKCCTGAAADATRSIAQCQSALVTCRTVIGLHD